MSKPDNFPWLSPYLLAKDIDELVKFYQKAFGFRLRGDDVMRDDNGKLLHCELEFHDTIIMVGSQEGWEMKKPCQSPRTTGVASPMFLYAYVDNVDEFFKHAVECGAKVLDEPEDQVWGDRKCTLEDPEGYFWSFGTHLNQ